MKRKLVKYTFNFNTHNERLKEKKHRELQLRREEEARKRSIIVKNASDLIKKYENYDIRIDVSSNIVALKKPLEVKYLPQFRYECNHLGFECKIGSKSTRNLYCDYKI